MQALGMEFWSLGFQARPLTSHLTSPTKMAISCHIKFPKVILMIGASKPQQSSPPPPSKNRKRNQGRPSSLGNCTQQRNVGVLLSLKGYSRLLPAKHVNYSHGTRVSAQIEIWVDLK